MLLLFNFTKRKRGQFTSSTLFEVLGKNLVA